MNLGKWFNPGTLKDLIFITGPEDSFLQIRILKMKQEQEYQKNWR